MQFEFATAGRIIFGNEAIKQVGALSKSVGRRALVISGKTIDRAEPVLDQLRSKNIEIVTFQVLSEPTIAVIQEGISRARKEQCDFVIGVGGGSVIDTGKIIAAMITNPGEIMDYLEVIGRGKQIEQLSAPFIAIPTTSGTGAEVTRNAVLRSDEHQLKVSIRSHLMLPLCAIVDPELTYSMPPSVTASTGLDALTQLIEAFVTKNANPMTDALCREGMSRAARSLRRAFSNGRDQNARTDMSIASLFSGIALANAGLGAVHGLAGPLGGMFSAPHGVICARLLPFVMEKNLQALQSRLQESLTLARFDELGQILTGSYCARAEEGLMWIHALCKELLIPPLSEFGLTEKDIAVVVEKSKHASSMKGNPIALTDEELADILMRAM